MQTTPQDLDRRRRVGDAIDALSLIGCDDIKSLDDDMLRAFKNAVWAVATYADIQIDIRHWARRDADTLRESADTQWPDAIEETAA